MRLEDYSGYLIIHYKDKTGNYNGPLDKKVWNSIYENKVKHIRVGYQDARLRWSLGTSKQSWRQTIVFLKKDSQVYDFTRRYRDPYISWESLQRQLKYWNNK